MIGDMISATEAGGVEHAGPLPYRAPRWLPGSHLQTLYPAFLPRPAVPYRRERWDTPDDDFIDLDWTDDRPGAPIVALFHGLEGDSRSHYALALMGAIRQRGWNGVVVHFRGCGGEENRLPRAYHSGDTHEAAWVLPRLKSRCAGVPLFVCAVSLGANLLLKWLGENGPAARDLVARAAAVSAPLDLMAAGDALERGFSRVYTRHFLKSLKPKTLAKLIRFPGLFDRERLVRARTMRQFDDAFTAPVHGFRDTDDYWTRCSSKPWLSRIEVPTLVLNARNDPFLPEAALPGPADVAPHVVLEFPREGGHVGFVSGPFPGNIGWLPQRLLCFFREMP